jgi:preprotein translocase subunit SecA
VDLDLSIYDEALSEINGLSAAFSQLTDDELGGRAREVRARVMAGTPLAEARSTLFALVREASWRAIKLRPFDVQVVAALALDGRRIVEMLTGEGKTLAAVMPVSLHALTGRGVHVLTFNDYLARRDAEWMGPIYHRVGLSVGFVQEDMSSEERRRAYLEDVTYVTAKEAGFDHLRDLLATNPSQVVHRQFHHALVDEADSLLIDEARIPLVIAGSFDHEHRPVRRLAELVRSFQPGLHFDLDEYGRDVEMTDEGAAAAEQALGCGGLHDSENYALLTALNCALHAQVLLRRDVDYLVRDGRVEIIDEFTGRVVHDRHWPDGLQAAIEAKEGLGGRPDGRILGSITLQHFLNGYPQLCGMTGTAQSAASELNSVYGLETIVIPTNRPMIRIDHPDVIFSTREAKMKALVEEIQRVHATGRPVLVGTPSVQESDRLSERLGSHGIDCQTLNARNDAAEATIIARAGAPGAVTVSTNMAGRGTDIALGDDDEADRARVAALGGLYVIGTSRHESARVDQQLRGRAGRQGDPGESRFFVSLEDDLLVQFGIRDLISGRITRDDVGPIENPIVRREVGRAQRIVEGQNLEIRKTLWRYASVVEDQRLRFLERRQAVLDGSTRADLWRPADGRRKRLVQMVGEAAVAEAEQRITLLELDRAWREHLALVAELRDGIHLVALGGRDPLTHFTSEVETAFSRLDESVNEAVLSALDRVRIDARGLDFSDAELRGPSSTWTYLVNDDPFRNQIGRLLTGPGRASVAIYAAVFLSPLLILWGAVDRWMGRRPVRRSGAGETLP